MTLRPFSADLQAQFRDTLKTPGAPETIDDAQSVMPVAVVATVNTATSAGYTQVTDGTDTLAVNTDGSLNIGLRSGTVVAAVRTSAGTTTLGTVGAGKTWYIVAAQMSVQQEGAGNTVQIQANGVDILSTYAVYSGTIAGSDAVYNIALNYSPGYPTLTAGQTLTFVTNGVDDCRCTVVYIEV